MKYDIKGISIVIPAQDEGKTIGQVLADCHQVCQRLHTKYEIIVVDDHSTDNTAFEVQSGGGKLVVNCNPRGKGHALIQGFNEAQYDVIVMMDADYSHRVEDIPLLLNEVEKGAGLVIASRHWGGSDEYNIIRHIGNLFLTFCFCIFFKVYITDCLNGYKAFRREIFTDFDYRAGGFEIEIELLANTRRAGLSITEVPSHERSRAAGEVKSRVIRDGLRFLRQIIKEGIKYRFRLLK